MVVDTIDMLGSSFVVSFFNIKYKTKATVFTKHGRGTSLLYTLSHTCLKSFDFIISLQLITIAKFLKPSEEDLQILEFVNPVL